MDDRAARRGELASGLATVRSRIAAAATAAGRDPAEVTLVVVTKTWPASDVELLYELGVRHFGENRHPESQRKAAGLGADDAVWHFVGRLQSNKARAVAGYADVVHSVDSVRLARRLDAGAQLAVRTVDCLVQVSLDPEGLRSGRSGVDESAADEVARAVDGAGALRLRGVMGVAPLGEEPEPAFRRLAAVRDRVLATFPAATWLSAGMTADFPTAIELGATHVRVGSAILGERPLLR